MKLEDYHLIQGLENHVRMSKSVQAVVRQSFGEIDRAVMCSRLRLLLLSEVQACHEASMSSSLPDFIASAGGYLSHLLDVEMAERAEFEDHFEVRRRVANLVRGVVGKFEFGEIGSLSCASDSGLVFENLVLLKSTFFVEDRPHERSDALEIEP